MAVLRKNTVNIILLVLLFLAIYIFLICETYACGWGTSDFEILEHPLLSAKILGANAINGVVLHFIGVNMADSERPIKRFFKWYFKFFGKLMAIFSTIYAVVCLLHLI